MSLSFLLTFAGILTLVYPSFPNTTGAFELDPTLASDFSKAWREMQGLKTDVFCAGSLILPDKAGRQLNVGGWSGESTFGVRLFTPDGAPGVNSSNEWEENFPSLQLQVSPVRLSPRYEDS